MIRSPRLLACAILLAPVICVGAESAPATTQPAARVLTEVGRQVDRPDERVSLLSNGMTVLLKAHRSAPVVSVRMYCRTGSIYEQEYLGSGMSHLFEHLLHGAATTTRSEERSREILNEIGGNTNAYTTYDVTCYFINTSKEHLSTAVSLLGDWITRPTFPQAAFEREWGVVQRELERDLDNPDEQLFQLLMTTMFREHPARYPIIGHQPIVQKLTKEDIVGYYRRMYVPDNIVVCVAGDIDLDAALALVQQQFASFTRQRVPNIVLPEEPPMTTPRFAVKRMKVPAAMVQLAWPSIPLTHPDLYALDVLSYILTQGDSSRLVRTVRDTGLAYTVDSMSWTPAWARGIFAVSMRLVPDAVEKARAAVLEQVELLKKDLVTPEELRQAQNQKAAEHVFASQTAESVAEKMVQDYLSTGNTHFSQAYVDGIQRVTPEQVREVARRYLLTDRMATISVLPEGGPEAAQPPAERGQPGEVRLIRLDNGLRCLIRRDPTTPIVAMQAYALGGVLLETPETSGYSRLAALTAVRGTSKRTAEQIARFFDSRGGSLEATSGANTIYFQSQVLSRDFPEALDVFADVVCNPTFQPAELDAVRPRVLDAIDQIDESWRTEVTAYVQRKLFGHASPYAMQPVGSTPVVRQAKAEEIAGFYRRSFTGPNTVVAIFGDVKPEEAESLVRRHFAGLSKGAIELPNPSEPGNPAPVLYKKEKPPTRGVAGVALGFHGTTVKNTDDVAALAMLQTVINGYRYPTGWLQDALRGGDRSLVYEVHSRNVPGLIPGSFVILAACEPAKVNDVYGIIQEHIRKARAGNFTAEEIERARTIIVTTELMENQTNEDRAMQAATDELYGLGYDYRSQYLERIRRIGAAEMRRVAEEYLVNPTVAVVTPAPQLVDIGIRPAGIDKDQPRREEGSQ